MPTLDIVTIGHEVLRKKAQPIPRVTKKIQQLIKDMIEAMYAADGVGLAAPQVGVSLRLIVLDVGDGPFAMINPEILQPEGSEVDVEGCLSVPGVHGYVRRWAALTVEYRDEKGKLQKIEADGLLARAVQHEIDHLDGVLFVDKMLEKVVLQPAREDDAADHADAADDETAPQGPNGRYASAQEGG